MCPTRSVGSLVQVLVLGLYLAPCPHADAEPTTAPVSGVAGWTIEELAPLDSLLWVHYADTGIATDDSGFVHVSYRDDTQRLAHVSNEPGTWQTSQFCCSRAARENAILIGPDGRIHISSSSRDGSDEDLVYWTRSPEGEWSQQTVASTQSVGLENDLALAPDGSVHISHWKWNNTDLMYSHDATGAWATSVIVHAEWDRTAVLVDSSGQVHLFYRSGSSLIHRQGNLGQTVESGLSSDAGVRAAIDGDDGLHLGLVKGSTLLYATNTSGGWTVQTVASGVESDRDHSIAVDGDGLAHLSYRDGDQQALYYATNASGSWTLELVDDDGDTGWSNDIAVDAFGDVHISYRRDGPESPVLRYATTSQCRGDDTTLDDDGDGVCGDLDTCPGFDDAADADGDGVADGCDQCPGGDDAADADLDGVCDFLDVCPGFDDTADSDADGVPDGCDLCLGDDTTGDTDLDGVCDDLDTCEGDDTSGDADDDGTCNDLDPPRVIVDQLPAYGSAENLAGQVLEADPAEHQVAVYLFLEGAGWWIKPTTTEPCTPLSGDGSFTVDVTTGGCDAYATRYGLYLLPASASCPLATGDPVPPEELGALALAETFVDRNPYLENPLDFAGRSWVKKEALCAAGPGPNLFDPDHVSVDAEGVLHLEIAFTDGAWRSAEVILDEELGYGEYRVVTASRLDLLDARGVLGLFTWDGAAPPYFRELDIEYSRWSDPDAAHNAQFVVQPYTEPENLHRFALDQSAGALELTHVVEWLPGLATFSVYAGRQDGSFDPGDLLETWSVSGAAIPEPGEAQFRLNLWLDGGLPPFDGLSQEVQVLDFDFRQTLVFADGFESGDVSAWSEEVGGTLAPLLAPSGAGPP